MLPLRDPKDEPACFFRKDDRLPYVPFVHGTFTVLGSSSGVLVKRRNLQFQNATYEHVLQDTRQEEVSRAVVCAASPRTMAMVGRAASAINL